MKTIYIDVRYSFSISQKSGKFNGGNNYVIKIIEILQTNQKPNVSIVLICTPNSLGAIQEQFETYDISFCAVNDLRELPYGEEVSLFVPQVNDSKSYAKELYSFKKNNPQCKIYVTVHDRRDKELIYDKYAGVLKSGIKSSSAILALGRKWKSRSVEKALNKIFKIADKVFTVSNYSMQALNKNKNITNINYFFAGVVNKVDETEKCAEKNFILFVSAGRTEKNFIRGLKAFEKYVAMSGDDDLVMIATGLSDKQQQKIRKKHFVRKSFLDQRVKMQGYVSLDELDRLYQECKFLLFVSRNEGFGLPVAEAAFHGKPSVLSWASAIPEVIGSAGLYVDPKSVASISLGIKQMMDPRYYEQRKLFVAEKAKIMKQQIALDGQILVSEILQ